LIWDAKTEHYQQPLKEAMFPIHLVVISMKNLNHTFYKDSE